MAYDLHSPEMHAILTAIILSGDRPINPNNPDPALRAVKDAADVADMIVKEVKKKH